MAPARVAESTSAPMSPITTQRSAVTSSAAAACSIEARQRLAAATTVTGSVVADQPRTEGSEQLLGPRVDVAHLLFGDQPAATPLWLLTTAVRMPRHAQTVERLAGAGNRHDPFGIAVVRHVLDQRAVTVEEHSGRPPSRHQAARRAASRVRGATWQRAGWPGSSRPSPRSRQPFAAPEDPAGAEVCRTSEPDTAGDAGDQPAARSPGEQCGDGDHDGCRRAHMLADRPRAGLGQLPPPRAVDAPHQHVVRIPDLGADARPPRGPTHRMVRRALAGTQSKPRLPDTQGEIGVFPVGTREALVEAADPLQRGPPIGHVRRGPARSSRDLRRCVPSPSVGDPAVGEPRCVPAIRPRSAPSARGRWRDRPASPVVGGRRRRGRPSRSRGRRASRGCALPPGRCRLLAGRSQASGRSLPVARAPIRSEGGRRRRSAARATARRLLPARTASGRATAGRSSGRRRHS